MAASMGLHLEETGDDGSLDALLPLKGETSSDIVCEEQHAHMSYGYCLWEVFSIKVRRNMKYCSGFEEVRIYGEIRLHYDGRFVDYLFKRSKDDPQVFTNPGEELSLTLQGPDDPRMLLGDLGEFAVYCILKYNDEFIFDAGRFTCVEEACSQLFDTLDHEDVGYGVYSLRHVPEAAYSSFGEPVSLFNEPFDRIPDLNKVASINLELAGIAYGMVGILKFTVSRDVILHGRITARACNLADSSILLFDKTLTEAVKVKSNEVIPLSRRIAAVDCRSSLIIKVLLMDASNGQLFHDTIHLDDDGHN